MIFLLLLVFFCFMLHKMCDERGISPWSYLTGFVAGFVLILFLTSAAIVYLYGQNVLNDPDLQKKIIFFTPVALVCDLLLFLFMRRKISKVGVYHDDDDDSNMPPPPSNEKKDLSYFR